MVAVLLPLPWHRRARNVATLSLIFWLTITNLVIFINSLVWAESFEDFAPAWCDVSECSLAKPRLQQAVG